MFIAADAHFDLEVPKSRAQSVLWEPQIFLSNTDMKHSAVRQLGEDYFSIKPSGTRQLIGWTSVVYRRFLVGGSLLRRWRALNTSPFFVIAQVATTYYVKEFKHREVEIVNNLFPGRRVRTHESVRNGRSRQANKREHFIVEIAVVCCRRRRDWYDSRYDSRYDPAKQIHNFSPGDSPSSPPP